jgi:hypothetical protein
MPTDNTLHALLFGVRRSVRYHNRRYRFFYSLNHWKMGLIPLFGWAAMLTLLAKSDPRISLVASALVVVVSTLDLVIGTNTMARLHADLARRFIELESELTLLKEPTDEELGIFTDRRLAIETDEPPIKRILDILGCNELMLGLGYSRDELYYVPGYKRMLAHIINFADESVLQYKQLKVR